MSGDIPCDIEAIWRCPFCGRPTWKIELPEQWGVRIRSDGYKESCYDDGITTLDTGEEV